MSCKRYFHSNYRSSAGFEMHCILKKKGNANAVNAGKSAPNSSIGEGEKSGESVSVAHWFGNSGNPRFRAE